MPEGDELAETREVVARLQERVDQRQLSGQYPAGLEEDLGGHFSQSAGRMGPREGARAVLLAELDRAGRFGPDRIPYGSSMPMGSRLHRAIGLVVRRQVLGIFEQLRDYHRAVRDLMLEVIDSLPETSMAELDARVEGMLDQLGRRARLLNADARAAGATLLRDEMHLIEARRGSRDTVLAQSADLADRLAASGVGAPIADLAAGRGEMLELLKARGLEVVAAEADPGLHRALREAGHEADAAGPLDFLATREDGSLEGIFAGQVLDREGPQAARRLAELAARKLRAGGLLLIEDFNPEYIPRRGEPVRPGRRGSGLGPGELKLLLIEAGFADVEVVLRGRPGERLESLPEDGPGTDLARAMNRNLNLLNEVLFAPREYAVFATR